MSQLPDSAGDPTLSVLMAVRAPAPYLGAALASLQGQSDGDWELVLVLDGPADEQITNAIDTSADPRIRVLTLPAAAGLATALNAGLATCRGRYVARMDADDVCLPERFARQVSHLEDNPELGLLGAHVEVIDSQDRHVGWRRTTIDHDAIARRLLWRNTFVHPSVLFRRELVVGVGGYDQRVVRLEDWELWLRLLGRTKVANLPEVLLQYRVHEQQHSRRRRFKSTELKVLRRSQMDAAARLGRSRIGAACRHQMWVVYQHLAHAKSLLPRRTAA